MNAMRYGALPIARATGGLNDTITDGKNGYIFTNSSSVELEETLLKAITIKTKSLKKHNRMVETSMKRDFSWTKSAKEYMQLYKTMLKITV